MADLGWAGWEPSDFCCNQHRTHLCRLGLAQSNTKKVAPISRDIDAPVGGGGRGGRNRINHALFLHPANNNPTS